MTLLQKRYRIPSNDTVLSTQLFSDSITFVRALFIHQKVHSSLQQEAANT